MGLVFESDAVRQNPTITATHVLLVGCGEYPSLAAAGYGGLKSLRSPRLSAGAMADWFLSGADAMPAGQQLPPDLAFHNPDAPGDVDFTCRSLRGAIWHRLTDHAANLGQYQGCLHTMAQ